MKKIPIELQIIFKVIGYCILGILLGMILVYILGSSKTITPQEKEWHFRDIVGINDFDKLTGSFAYSDEELRFEIDIWHSNEYTCLSYNPVLMYNFQLIEDNPSI